MKLFTLKEIKIVSIILTILFGVVLFNMSISLRRGRDSIRKNDISAIQKSLDTYYQKYRVYPLSNDTGQIIGCFDGDVVRDKSTGAPLNTIACSWGESRFEDKNLMPRDPLYKKGNSYKYISDGKSYEIYISLEGKDEAEYTPQIAAKYLQCGTKICNYGRVQE
jgi:type II secretory pathway pseudopilin PulG